MSAKKGIGLGRGFDALLPQNLEQDLLDAETERIRKVAVDSIVRNNDQPRQSFDTEAIKQLADSISRYGILQPLVVMPKGSKYIIVAGERRWRAAQVAGLSSVPVIVRSLKELETLEVALIENVQRVDLSPLEQAVSIEKLHQQFSLSYDAIAKRLGKAQSTVVNIVRLLQLPPEAREALEAKKITEGHARAVLALKDAPNKQAELLAAIMTYGWSVRQAERFVLSVKKGIHATKEAVARVASETPETTRLSEQLGVPVTLRRTAKGGRLELGFKTDEELQELLERLATLQASHPKIT